ncbi:GNAT family N-acetyltransferase [Streptomyces sp. NPDC051658]|uniref:GNAT family N-acetyltransferase n=1 Tax=Streptomyces sp. NPDC051658 TaxID=3365667 RepID=UPI0037B6ABC0
MRPSPLPQTPKQWLQRRKDQWRRRVAYSFAVADSTDTALGSVAVSNVDPRHATGWVSYWTASAARGRGVATHGCRALADWCFADLGLFRLELGHRTDNPASRAADGSLTAGPRTRPSTRRRRGTPAASPPIRGHPERARPPAPRRTVRRKRLP